MQAEETTHSAQQGFAIGMILVVVILIAAIGAFLSTTGSSNTTLAERQRAGTIASSIMSQAADVDNAIAQALKNGFTIDNIRMASSGCTYNEFCLFDEQYGMANAIPVNGALEDTTEMWELKNLRMSFDAYGGDVITSTPEWVIILKGVKNEICRQINMTNNRFASDYEAKEFRDTSGTDPAGGSATEITLAGSLTNKYYYQGCFTSNSTAINYLYRVIMAN